MKSVERPLPEFGQGLLVVMVRRARLIDELRSGRFIQTDETLYSSDVQARGRTFVEGQRWGGYCCIGVGCALLRLDDMYLVEEADNAYVDFRQQYYVSEKVQKYLIGENDGSSVQWRMGETKIIRASGAGQRNFHQIARFLEIIWGFNGR